MSLRRRASAGAIALLASAGLLAACGTVSTTTKPVTAVSGFNGAQLSPPFTVPAGSFTDTAGTSYDLATQAAGHLTLLYFGYTHCPDVCPTTMADLGAALRSLPAATTSNVRVVFVTSDPARDTPAVMQGWLAHFDSGLAHPFVGLTASLTQIDAYAAKLGIPLEAPTKESDGEIEVTHGAEVLVFSPDGKANLVWLPGTTPPQYAADIRKLEAGEV